MALKAYLESTEGLSPDLAGQYKQIEQDGKQIFVLDVEGAYLSNEDVGPLKRAKDYEKSGRQEAEKKLKQFHADREKLQEELDEIRRGAIPKGDVEKLEGSWKEKLAKQEVEFKSQLSARDKTLQQLLVDNIAQKMSTDLSGESAHLILPHIKNRLTTEIQDGTFVTRVLDREGKPSAASIEELQKELANDKRFAPIIIGSKASGGGASGANGNGSGAPAAVRVDPKFDWNKASPKEIAAQLEARRQATGG